MVTGLTEPLLALSGATAAQALAGDDGLRQRGPLNRVRRAGEANERASPLTGWRNVNQQMPSREIRHR
jgi:hypothetical protein